MRILYAFPLVVGLWSATAYAEEKRDEDKLVCKRTEVGYTGTRVGHPRKTCMKASDWRALENGAEASIRKVQSGGNNPAPDRGIGTGGQ